MLTRSWIIPVVLGLALGAAPAGAQDQDALRPNKTAPQGQKVTPSKAFLGITVGPAQGEGQAGAVVQQVMPDSPAARAGLKKGDVIRKVGSQRVDGYDDLVNALSGHKPGDDVAFEVQRRDRIQHLTVTLGDRAREEGRERGDSGEARPEKGVPYLGVRAVPVGEFPERLRDQIGLEGKEGVVVIGVMPRSPAAKAGLRHGDLITAVNGTPIRDPEALRQAVRKAGVGKEVRVQVLREGEKEELRTRLEESPVEGLGFALPGLGLPGAEESGAPGALFPGTEEMNRRLRRMERQIEQLQERIRELEQRRGTTPSDKLDKP